jgi:alpha-beta hydrolase superfamily lysophospholipase
MQAHSTADSDTDTDNDTDNDTFERRWPLAEGVLPKANIVIAHGLGEHSGRYEKLAQSLNNDGYAVASVDLPGHGKSAGRRGHIEDFVDYHAPLLALTLALKREQPQCPVFILGHSLGGLIVGHMMLDHQELYSGIVLTGSAIQNPQQPPDWQITLTRLIARIAPTLGLITLDIKGLCRDQQVVESYLQDPLVSRSKLSASFIAAMFVAVSETVEKAADITRPVLILHGGDDTITDPAGSKLLYDRVSSVDKTHKVYPGFYHEIFNEPDASQVVDDVLQWLNARCSH